MKTGAPAFVDVTASDDVAAREFYSRVFGWTYDLDFDPTGGVIYADLEGVPVACMRTRMPDAPAAWTAYLAAQDAEATVAVAGRAGGTLLHGPAAASGQGVLAALTDPAGASFAVWQQTGGRQLGTGRPGMVNWFELTVPDSGLVDSFYQDVFGYAREQIGDGKAFDYEVWSVEGQPRLGRMVGGTDSHPQWMVYFEVSAEDGADGAVERAVAAGGSVLRPPTTVGSGRVAVLADCEGASFAVVDPSRRE